MLKYKLMNQTQTQRTTFETYQTYRQNALLNNKDKTTHPIIYRHNKNTPSRIQHISTSKLAAMTTGNIIRISASSSSKGINLVSSRQNSLEKTSNNQDNKSKIVDTNESQATILQNQSIVGGKYYYSIVKNEIELVNKQYSQLMQRLLLDQQHSFQIQINKLNDIIRQNQIKLEMQRMKLEEFYEKQQKREKRNAQKINFLRVDIEGLIKFQQQCDNYTLARISDIDQKVSLLKEKQAEISPYRHRQLIQLIRKKVVNIISHYFEKEILQREECIYIVQKCQSNCEALRKNLLKIEQQGHDLWMQMSLKNQVASEQINYFKNYLKIWQQQQNSKLLLNQINQTQQRQVDYQKLKNTFESLKNNIELLDKQKLKLQTEKAKLFNQLKENQQKSQNTITQLSKIIHSLKAEQQQFTTIYHQEINQKQNECSLLKNQLQNSHIFESVTDKQVKNLQQKNAQLCIQLRRKQKIYEHDILEANNKVKISENILKQQIKGLNQLAQNLKRQNQRRQEQIIRYQQLQFQHKKIQSLLIKQKQQLKHDIQSLRQQIQNLQSQLATSKKENKILKQNFQKILQKKYQFEISASHNLFVQFTKNKKNASSITQLYDLSIPLQQFTQSSQIKQQLSTKSQYINKLQEKFTIRNNQNLKLKQLCELSKDQNIRLRKAILQLQKQNRFLMQAKQQAIQANDKYQANMNQYINTFERHSFAFQNTIKALQQEKQKLQQQINSYKQSQSKTSLQKCMSSSLLNNTTQSPTSLQYIAYKTISFDELGSSKKFLAQSQISPSHNSTNLSRYSNTSTKKTMKIEQTINRLENALKSGQFQLPLECEIDQTGYLKNWEYGTYIIDQHGNLFDLNREQLINAIQFKLILLR